MQPCHDEPVIGSDRPNPRGLFPLVALSAVVVLVALGFGSGWWLPNLHNGLLALAFALVGCYVLNQRPRHREGMLFMATGVVEAVLFFGRQIGHGSHRDDGEWWGWLGVWPLVVALALTTFSVICFPDGRLPSRSWRWVAVAVIVVTAACATLSAVWPVEYESAGLTLAHPIIPSAPAWASVLWSAIAHPAYVGFQLLWVVALAFRWHTANGPVRRQLTWLLSAAALSVTALIVGLVLAGSPVAGLLSAALLPVAAGWAIVHGRYAAAYSALSWLSRTRALPADLPADVARATVEAFAADGATLWMGDADALHAVGIWPPTPATVGSTDLTTLVAVPGRLVRLISRDGVVTGVLTVDRAGTPGLSRAEDRLLGDLAAQAFLVIQNLSLAELIAGERRAGNLEALRPREQQVLKLMARGLSNAAICTELHLSVKTVEPIVSGIFAKLELHADAASNRRVLAVLAFLRA